MRNSITLLLALATFAMTNDAVQAQCSIDFDFGTETLVYRPIRNGEQFEPGVINNHMKTSCTSCCLNTSSRLIQLFPFSPRHSLDSVSLATISLVDLSDTLGDYNSEAVGLEVICNNNGTQETLARSLVEISIVPR